MSSFSPVKSSVVPAGTLIPFRVIVEQPYFCFITVAASVNSQVARGFVDNEQSTDGARPTKRSARSIVTKLDCNRKELCGTAVAR